MAGRKQARQQTPNQSPSETMRAADTANGERDTLAEHRVADQPATVPVTFHRIAHEASSVALAGDFNGWHPGSHPMTREGDVFSISVELPAGTTQRYRFVVDGHRWEDDPTAASHVDNPYGGRDAVVDLSDRRPDQPVI
jgi:1,4-alpha-glucan branching enzyme